MSKPDTYTDERHFRAGCDYCNPRATLFNMFAAPSWTKCEYAKHKEATETATVNAMINALRDIRKDK